MSNRPDDFDQPFNPTEVTTIQLAGGKISALTDGNLIHARGIKYGTAVRFQRPQPIASWDGTWDCTKQASICPQNPDAMAIAIGDIAAGRQQSEDCLHLRIIAPMHAQNAPVMVFLHGGAYITGGGDLDVYTPSGLASRGVVCVTVTYRLGVFGYLPLPGVAVPNLGLLDQIEALKWVQGNISSFGGDSAKVTLFGQSAGGDSIYCLLAAENTEGLFHRAILQSGVLPARLFEHNRTEMTLAMAHKASKYFSTPSNACSMSTDSLLGLQNDLWQVGIKYSDTLAKFAPIFGSYPLPPEAEARSRIAAIAKRIPIMVGYTTDEGTPFEKNFGEVYDADRVAREVFQLPVDDLRRDIQAAVGRCPAYEFSWYPEGNNGLKATHCIEMPFLLGSWNNWKDAPMLQGKDAEEVFKRLGTMVKDMWVAFANGDDFGGRRIIIDAEFVFP